MNLNIINNKTSIEPPNWFALTGCFIMIVTLVTILIAINLGAL